MKISTRIIILLLTLFISANLLAKGQGEINKGSADFKEKDFHSIRNTLSADLEIRISENWSVEAIGDEKSLRQLRIYKRNGVLVIRRKFSINPFISFQSVQIKISMPGTELKALTLSSSGNAEILGQLNTEETKLSTSSRGSITAEGDVEYLNVRSSSSGNISFSGNCRQMNIRLSSSGDTRIQANILNLEATISGSGNIYIDGGAVETTLKISSSGEFYGENFITEAAEVTLSSSGNVEMTIMKNLDARLSGSGNLNYKGNPTIGNIRESGSGRILTQ